MRFFEPGRDNVGVKLKPNIQGDVFYFVPLLQEQKYAIDGKAHLS